MSCGSVDLLHLTHHGEVKHHSLIRPFANYDSILEVKRETYSMSRFPPQVVENDYSNKADFSRCEASEFVSTEFSLSCDIISSES